jgi:hypothetical protein
VEKGGINSNMTGDGETVQNDSELRLSSYYFYPLYLWLKGGCEDGAMADCGTSVVYDRVIESKPSTDQIDA